MTTLDIDKLTKQLVRHEGKKLYPYRCTAGKLTIGVGRNIEDRGISDSEAEMLLHNDIQESAAALSKRLPFFTRLDDVRKRVLVNMSFMGVERLMGFTRMLAAVQQGNYTAAAAEMLNSKWARQVKGRADELARMMETGMDA